MAGLCKITLIGNLGRDPEISYTPEGLAVAKFNVAVTEKVKGADRTEWFRITAFGKLGEICGQYLAKGKQVYVEGRLQINEWQDREGNKRYSPEVNASQVVMLGVRGEVAENAETPLTEAPAQKSSPAVGETPTVQKPKTSAAAPSITGKTFKAESPDIPAPQMAPPGDDDIPF